MRVYSGQWRKPLKQKLPNAGTKRIAQHKRKYQCVGGVLDGEFLYLATPITAIFSMANQKGFYQPMENETKKLEWVSCK